MFKNGTKCFRTQVYRVNFDILDLEKQAKNVHLIWYLKVYIRYISSFLVLRSHYNFRKYIKFFS